MTLNFKVAIVDDDQSLLRALNRLLTQSGYDIETYDTAEALIAKADLTDIQCFILDMQLPGMDGLAMQDLLCSDWKKHSVVFLTGNGNVVSCVKAMKAGAVDFLTKPIDIKRLLQAVESGVQRSLTAHEHETHVEDARRKLALLTPREYQVLMGVISGKLNKQIAGDLGTVEKTVKVHRGRVVGKLGVRSAVELARLVALAKENEFGLDPSPTIFDDAPRL